MDNQEDQLRSIQEKLVLDILSASKYHAFESWPSAIDGTLARRGALVVPSILQAKILAEFLRENKIDLNLHRFNNRVELRFTTPRNFESFILQNSMPLYIDQNDIEKIRKHDAEELEQKNQIPSYETCGYTQAAIERLTTLLTSSEQILLDA